MKAKDFDKKFDDDKTVIQGLMRLPQVPQAPFDDDLTVIQAPTSRPPPPSTIESKVVTKGSQIKFIDWGIVAALVALVVAAVFAISGYIRGPIPKQITQETTMVGLIPESEPRVDEPEPPPLVFEAPPEKSAKATSPTELYLNVQTISSNQVRIDVRTDASADFPVYVQIVGLPGQVAEGPSYYRYLKFSAEGEGLRPVDLSGLKLPQGKFFFRVSTGDLRKEARVSVGVNEVQFKEVVAKLRKQHAHIIWAERLALFKLSTDLEKELTGSLGGLKFNARKFESLASVKRSNGGKYVMFDSWYELKEIVQEARAGISKAQLARTRNLRERLASFSVWK